MGPERLSSTLRCVSNKISTELPPQKLWRQLAKRGLGGAWINLLKEIYKETTVVAQWQEEMTHPVAITKGLRQGCPLSPLLFMLYIAGFEKRLQDCAEGFTLEYTKTGTSGGEKIPGLIYADDIVLMADSLEGLQALMNECNTMGTALGLSFSAKKSALMGFGDRGDTEADDLKIQGEQVPWVSQYKYLGIHIQEGHNYLEDHETRLQAKSRRSKGISTARALWGYNRFEISRAVWKMVAVPGLTFGNGVLCLSSRTRECLEVRQREVGRAALGASRGTPNEAVQGDMVWSSFDAREARAKLGFERRLCQMQEGRGSGLLFDARGGMLRQVHRGGMLQAKYIDTDVRCTLCTQGAKETLQHVILECAGLQPEVPCSGDMAVALGFREIKEEGSDGADSTVGRGPRPIPVVEWTKRRLDHWWKKN
ncbi:uncharacterized protein ISCGN_014578 [Ixodes scapularis]